MSVVERAKKKYDSDSQCWSSIYAAARSDLAFLSDDEFAQWNEREAKRRADSGRPVLTIDQLGQFVHRVANSVRQNTPSISVIPSDGGDVDTADIFKGLIRNIEYLSGADDIYDTACNFAIKCSIGFIRVDHDYVNDESFNQELKIYRVVNPLAITIDANSIMVDGSDAMHGHVLEPISVAEFKRRFPGKEVCSFDSKDNLAKELTDEDMVTICEYFEIKIEDVEMGLLPDGSIEDVRQGVEYKRTRTKQKRTVMRYTLSGKEELEKTTFPGKYIPLIPVYGEEAWKEGKRHIFSLIRKSKDAQRMYNYWKSLETEMLQRQPKAYTLVAEGQIEEYLDDWADPDKAVALTYKTTDAEGNPVAAPQILQPPTIPAGFVNASRGAVDDIKSTMGIYNAALGQISNETSGVAIARRKEEGDVATYHFPDNLAKSIAHVGRVLVSAIPEIYDTPRIIRIIGLEDDVETVGINGMMTEEQEREYDLTQGQYDVRVVTGVSYATKRQETADFLNEIVARNPQMLEVIGDILFENMDVAGAQAIAERLKRIMKPELLEEGDTPDPEKMQLMQALEAAAQQLEAAQAEAVKLQEQLKDKQAENVIKAEEVARKAEEDRRNHEIKMMELQLEAQKNEQDADYKARELALKERTIELKEAEVIAKNRLEQEKMMLDAMESEQREFREESAAYEGAGTQYEGTENV